MREKTLIRKTKETEVSVSVNLDQPYGGSINTGVPFLNHMLDAFSCHADITMQITATGDLEIDDHHTVEDVGIVLGQVLKELLFIEPINRYATSYVPMDESLSRVVLDISNRSYLHYNVSFRKDNIGNMTLSNFEEFFLALVNQSCITLHIENLYGSNDHHKIESIFKAFGRAFKEAIVKKTTIQSTKGVL